MGSMIAVGQKIGLSFSIRLLLPTIFDRFRPFSPFFAGVPFSADVNMARRGRARPLDKGVARQP